MANRERGEFRLVAGETTYILRLTTNACCELEDFVGKPWSEILNGGRRGSLRDVRSILWAALREHHGDVATFDDKGLAAVGRVIDAGGGVVGVHGQIKAFLALNADSGDERGGQAGAGARPPNAQAGIGVSSTLTH